MTDHRAHALATLARRTARAAPFHATRERAQLLTPARDAFDGTFPDPTALLSAKADDGDAVPDVAPLVFPGVKAKRPADGPFIVRKGAGAAEPEGVVRGEIVLQCADTIGMLTRHRVERPMHELADNEAQLFTQLDALAISGGDVVRSLVSFWRENAEHPWKAQGVALALACLDGIDVLEAIFREIEALPPDQDGLVIPLAEALLVAPHSNVPDLARDLLASPSPISRAVALEALARRAPLSVEEIRPHLADAHPAVVGAAVRACAAIPPPVGLPLLMPLVGRPQMGVAWPAARQLLVWGRPEPYFEVRSGRAAGLGPFALEVLVLAGGMEDLELFDQLAAKEPASPALVSAIARFGAPTAWALLCHHLGDDELSDAAARALATVFGDRVPLKEVKKPAAWRAAIAKGRFDGKVRTRRGEPWRPRTVVAEMRRGDFPRVEMRARIDELMARTGARVDAELGRWAPDTWSAIHLSIEAFDKADAHYPPGTWTTRAR